VLDATYEGAKEREALESRANASLIAAAPELLEFAQRYVKEWNQEDQNLTRLEELATAAIAKATHP
jgi:hypothetical protein